LTKQYKDQRDELYRLAVSICNDYENEVDTILRRLADSDNWEVREWVASACGLILEKHLSQVIG
jgi:hypothetical protein